MKRRLNLWKLVALLACPLFGMSVLLNALQAKRILELQQGPTPSRSSLLGMRAPAIHAIDLNGRQFVAAFNSHSPKGTVLYVFSPSCIWCQRNVDAFNKLTTQAKTKYDFVALSLSSVGVEEFVRKHSVTVPVYQDVSAETLAAYGFGSTPETVVISTDGTVVSVWPGAYRGATRTGVEKFFSVDLGGGE